MYIILYYIRIKNKIKKYMDIFDGMHHVPMSNRCPWRVRVEYKSDMNISGYKHTKLIEIFAIHNLSIVFTKDISEYL